MKSVSAKELRVDLPHVLKKVEEGEEFVIIYHSRPVGEIIPLRRKRPVPRAKSLFQLLKEPFGEVKFGKGRSAADLVREDRD